MSLRPRRRRVAARGAVVSGAVVMAVGLLAGCGAAVPAGGAPPGPSGSAVRSPVPPPSDTAAPPVPAEGITLRELGFQNGPVDAFFVPRTVVITDRVDQPNAVTVVVSAPGPAELARYYRMTLPRASFTVTADDAATNTLTFTGHGWSGVLTGADGTTAVSLRPTG